MRKGNTKDKGLAENYAFLKRRRLLKGLLLKNCFSSGTTVVPKSRNSSLKDVYYFIKGIL